MSMFTLRIAVFGDAPVVLGLHIEELVNVEQIAKCKRVVYKLRVGPEASRDRPPEKRI